MLLCLTPRPLLPVGVQAATATWVCGGICIVSVTVDYSGHAEIVVRRAAANMQVESMFDDDWLLILILPSSISPVVDADSHCQHAELVPDCSNPTFNTIDQWCLVSFHLLPLLSSPQVPSSLLLPPPSSSILLKSFSTDSWHLKTARRSEVERATTTRTFQSVPAFPSPSHLLASCFPLPIRVPRVSALARPVGKCTIILEWQTIPWRPTKERMEEARWKGR